MLLNMAGGEARFCTGKWRYGLRRPACQFRLARSIIDFLGHGQGQAFWCIPPGSEGKGIDPVEYRFLQRTDMAAMRFKIAHFLAEFGCQQVMALN